MKNLNEEILRSKRLMGLSEGLNLPRRDKVDTSQIKACTTHWPAHELEKISQIADGLYAKFLDNFSTGGGCEIIALHLPNGRIITFSNITDDVCVTEKTYDTAEQYYEDWEAYNGEDNDGICKFLIDDVTNRTTKEIIDDILSVM